MKKTKKNREYKEKEIIKEITLDPKNIAAYPQIERAHQVPA